MAGHRPHLGRLRRDRADRPSPPAPCSASPARALRNAARPGRGARRPGAFGLGAVVEPVPFLAELASRGVKAAAFEGVAVA